MAMTERTASSARRRTAAYVLLTFALLATSISLISARVLFAQQDPRAKELSMRMMCVCGCNQVLGVCNHVGCSYSHDMLKEIDSRVSRSESDDLILQDFVQEYGSAVLLLPAAKGLSFWMWLMPIVAVGVGIWLVRIALIRWRRNAAVAAPVHVAPQLLERARREIGPDE
jgi:cytochrome c-type biogenesis protein CcmH